jgi:hypothetical protein
MVSGQETSIIPIERIHKCIFVIRGQKVILDRDLAELYGVETRVLNQTVKRNLDRFPEDFMFQLDIMETEKLVTNCDRFASLKHATSNPYAFTEQGVAMLSSVLRSKQAIEVNIAIMRTFVQLRRILADNELLRKKIESLEKKYEEQFEQIFTVLQLMLAEDEKPKKQIGYHAEAKESKMKGCKRK